MDVDGTITDIGGKGKIMDQSPLEHLVRFVMEKYSVDAEEAKRKIQSCGDLDINCLSEFLPELGIDEEEYFSVLRQDLTKHITIQDDAIVFLKVMREKKIPVYATTANSRFMTFAKLSVRGLADCAGSEFLAGCHPGNEFHDPLGKFSRNFYQNILKNHDYSPDKTIMIGDEPEYDLYPALKAGIGYGAIINRSQKGGILHKDGGIFVNSLRTLANIITRQVQ